MFAAELEQVIDVVGVRPGAETLPGRSRLPGVRPDVGACGAGWFGCRGRDTACAVPPARIEAEVVKLDRQARARLAKKLLESLETLTEEENDHLWAEEAERRDADWDRAPESGRSAAEVLRDARTRLK